MSLVYLRCDKCDATFEGEYRRVTIKRGGRDTWQMFADARADGWVAEHLGGPHLCPKHKGALDE